MSAPTQKRHNVYLVIALILPDIFIPSLAIKPRRIRLVIPSINSKTCNSQKLKSKLRSSAFKQSIIAKTIRIHPLKAMYFIRLAFLLIKKLSCLAAIFLPDKAAPGSIISKIGIEKTIYLFTRKILLAF